MINFNNNDKKVFVILNENNEYLDPNGYWTKNPLKAWTGTRHYAEKAIADLALTRSKIGIINDVMPPTFGWVPFTGVGEA